MGSQRNHKLRRMGFTLVELMIVVAILGIVAAIAYPSFIEQMRKSRRADAKAALTNAAQQIERAYTLSNSYITAVSGVVGSGYLSDEKYYKVVEKGATTASAYTLEAQPQAKGGQSSDKCGNFTLTSTGVKGVNGGSITDKDSCW